MPGVVCRNTVLISQDINRNKTAFRERCLLRGAAKQAEQKFSDVCYRGRVNGDGIGTVLHWLVPQRDCANGTGHQAIIGSTRCDIFLNHRHKIIVVAEFSEKVLKHGAGRACPNGLVSPSQLVFELQETSRRMRRVRVQHASRWPRGAPAPGRLR